MFLIFGSALVEGVPIQSCIRISPTAAWILHVLSHHDEPLNVTTIITMLQDHTTERSIYRALKELESYRFTHRTIYLPDTRYKNVKLTAKGKAYVIHHRLNSRKLQPPRKGRPRRRKTRKNT